MIQLGHNFAYVMTAELLHVEILDLVGSLELQLQQKIFHKFSGMNSQILCETVSWSTHVMLNMVLTLWVLMCISSLLSLSLCQHVCQLFI